MVASHHHAATLPAPWVHAAALATPWVHAPAAALAAPWVHASPLSTPWVHTRDVPQVVRSEGVMVYNFLVRHGLSLMPYTFPPCLIWNRPEAI